MDYPMFAQLPESIHQLHNVNKSDLFTKSPWMFLHNRPESALVR